MIDKIIFVMYMGLIWSFANITFLEIHALMLCFFYS